MEGVIKSPIGFYNIKNKFIKQKDQRLFTIFITSEKKACSEKIVSKNFHDSVDSVFYYVLQPIFNDFGKIVWLFMYFLFWKKESLQAFGDYILFLEFLEINKNIFFSCKFEKSNVSENDLDENITMQTIENNYGLMDTLINCFRRGKFKNNAFWYFS